MLKVAFASTDQVHVNLHFGAGERFVVYEVAPGQAELIGVGEFVPVEMKGDKRDSSLGAGQIFIPGEEMEPTLEFLEKPAEDKVIAKLEFLKGCHAVYASSIGTSSIKRLIGAGIQPIIVENGREIIDLLNELNMAMGAGGVGWVDKALAKPKDEHRFDALEEEGWHAEEPAHGQGALV